MVKNNKSTFKAIFASWFESPVLQTRTVIYTKGPVQCDSSFNGVNVSKWCFLYATRHIRSQIRNKRHIRAFPPCTCSVPITGPQTGIGTARASFVTYLRNQSGQPAGWGYSEASAIRGEAWWSYVLSMLQAEVFSKRWQRRVLFLLQSCKRRNGEPSCFTKGCERLQEPFSQSCLTTKLTLKPDAVHPFILETRREWADMLFSR